MNKKLTGIMLVVALIVSIVVGGVGLVISIYSQFQPIPGEHSLMGANIYFLTHYWYYIVMAMAGSMGTVYFGLELHTRMLRSGL